MRLRMIALATALLSGAAVASPAAPVNGAEFTTLAAPQPAQAGKKVEVIEFFMYHCPACYELEPALVAWVKKNADNVVLRRIHLPHGPNDPEAHLFLTLEAMKLEQSMHDKVLHTWHVERKRLKSDADNLDWAASNGLDKARFGEVYQSFGVVTKLKNLDKLAAAYQVNSTPTLVVDGKYISTPSMVADSNPSLPRNAVSQATLQVIDMLVTKAKAGQAR